MDQGNAHRIESVVAAITAANFGGTSSVESTFSVIEDPFPLGLEANGIEFLEALPSEWELDSNDATADGIDALKSRRPGALGFRVVSIRVNGPDTLLLDWKLESSSKEDWFRMTTWRGEAFRSSGSPGWHSESIPLDEGSQVITFRFWVSGGDPKATAHLDQFRLLSDRDSFFLTTPASLKLDQALDWQLPLPTNRPAVFWSADGLPAWIQLDATTGVLSGTPVDLGERCVHRYGLRRRSHRHAPDQAGCPALPFGGARSPLSWRRGGAADWFPQSDEAVVGDTAARSGAIDGGTTSWIETTIHGPDTLSFRWKASTNENQNFVTALIDGVEINRLGGVTDWESQSINIPGGRHQVRFVYLQNDPDSENAVWLDGLALGREFIIPHDGGSVSYRLPDFEGASYLPTDVPPPLESHPS